MSEIAELKRRLGINSGNSSKPPSSDFQNGVRKQKSPGGRKRGGQPGHDRNERAMVPSDKVDQVIEHVPSVCEKCEMSLSGRDPLPSVQQIMEVPPIEPKTTEHRYHSLECDSCGHVTRARRPEGVPAGGFGPRLMAMMAVCTAKYRMSKRTAQELFEDFLGVKVSLGAISKIEATVSEALVEPVAEARELAKAQEVAHVDETGWRENKKKAWLWVMVTALVTVYEVSRSRGAKVAKGLLGVDWAGFLVSDRWSAYLWVDVLHRQLCWAHLIRDFRSVAEGAGVAAKLGKALLGQADKMFREWQKVRDGTLSRDQFRRRIRHIPKKVGRLLRRMERSGDQHAEGMARDLLSREVSLWTFLYVDGVEPTNNTAERAVRHAVLWRKGSFGTDSESGSRYVERMLTAVATLRQNNCHVLDYLTKAIAASLNDNPVPSFIPKSRPRFCIAA